METSFPQAPPAVCVVVVTYDSDAVLPRFLSSLGDATSADVQLVVVDNGSRRPPTPEELPAGAQLVLAGRNLGYGAAANLGAQAATSPWLVIANPDVTWRPGSLTTLLESARRWPRAGALGPAILEPDGSVYPSARQFPSLRTGVGHALLSRVWPSNPWSRRYRQTQEAPELVERTTGWLSGACLLLRREAFDAVDGFDEGYFMFFEDVDLCDRLDRAGWQRVYVPDAQVLHEQGHSWRSRPAAMIRAHHTSAYRYLSKRYHRWFEAPLRLVLRLALLARRTVELAAARARRR